jgi:enoyl-CoA hydratase/carnithine racemase
MARRYHWLTPPAFDSDPHAAVAGRSEQLVLNLVAAEGAGNRRVATQLAREQPSKIVAEITRLKEAAEGPRKLVLPRRHAALLSDVLNAMNWEVFDGLARAADEVAGAGGIRVVVIQGEGRSFSSGIDTSSFADSAGAPTEMIGRAQAGFRKIAALPLPTIAAVKGHALGAGLQLALACDVRVVTRDCSLGILESKYGLVPDLGGTQRLPALVGPGRAKKMIWLAERFDGVEAGRVGLAEVVVEPAELDDRVDDLANRLAAAPPLVVREVKRLVTLAQGSTLEAGMDEEAASQRLMFSSQDFGEAMTAFIEGRAPVFAGA